MSLQEPSPLSRRRLTRIVRRAAGVPVPAAEGPSLYPDLFDSAMADFLAQPVAEERRAARARESGVPAAASSAG